MTRTKPIRILIADDHPMIRMAIKSMIENENNMEIVGVAPNGAEAVRLFEEQRPQITIMDINMPLMTGWEAIEKIRELDSEARIIVLTNYDSDEDIHRGLESGAMGYLLKDAAQDLLLETIRTVHSGQRYVPKKLAERLILRMSHPQLSPREMHVLRLMMAGKSNRAIGLELGITESTVKSHVKNILIKMNVNDRTQAVTKALQWGILNLGT